MDLVLRERERERERERLEAISPIIQSPYLGREGEQPLHNEAVDPIVSFT